MTIFDPLTLYLSLTWLNDTQRKWMNMYVQFFLFDSPRNITYRNFGLRLIKLYTREQELLYSYIRYRVR